jgi:hypothetical protein
VAGGFWACSGHTEYIHYFDETGCCQLSIPVEDVYDVEATPAGVVALCTSVTVPARLTHFSHTGVRQWSTSLSYHNLMGRCIVADTVLAMIGVNGYADAYIKTISIVTGADKVILLPHGRVPVSTLAYDRAANVVIIEDQAWVSTYRVNDLDLIPIASSPAGAGRELFVVNGVMYQNHHGGY